MHFDPSHPSLYYLPPTRDLPTSPWLHSSLFCLVLSLSELSQGCPCDHGFVAIYPLEPGGPTGSQMRQWLPLLQNSSVVSNSSRREGPWDPVSGVGRWAGLLC